MTKQGGDAHKITTANGVIHIIDTVMLSKKGASKEETGPAMCRQFRMPCMTVRSELGSGLN